MAGLCIILMGVSGTGKSSVGTALANGVSLLQAPASRAVGTRAPSTRAASAPAAASGREVSTSAPAVTPLQPETEQRYDH